MFNKLLLGFAVFLLNGCLNNQDASSNQGELSKNVGHLLSRYNINSANMNCRMIQETRTGICLLEILPASVQDLKDRLKLTLLPSYQVNFWKQEEGCSSQQPFASVTDVYGITGRPSVLKIDNTTNFEYLLLYYHPQTSKICLQVSYSYG